MGFLMMQFVFLTKPISDARIPLPRRARLSGVTRVSHEGKEEKWPANRTQVDDQPYLEMRIEDSGQEAMYFRVQYELR